MIEKYNRLLDLLDEAEDLIIGLRLGVPEPEGEKRHGIRMAEGHIEDAGHWARRLLLLHEQSLLDAHADLG